MARMNYKQTMRTLMEDLSDLLEKKETLEDRLQEVIERIVTVREAAWSMSDLAGIDPEKEYPHLFAPEAPPDVGFTDAIREVFRANLGLVLTPVGVRNKLKERGFKLENYKNPLASIHTILKRLEKQGELHGWQDDEDSPTGYAMTPKTIAEIDATINRMMGTEDTPYKDSFGKPLTEAEYQERERQIKERAERKAKEEAKRKVREQLTKTKVDK